MEKLDEFLFDPQMEDDFLEVTDLADNEIIDEEDDPFYRSLDDY